MADIFDAVDKAYEIVQNCGVTFYKDKAPESALTGKTMFGVITTLNYEPKDEVSKVPINFNVYVPKTASGMINRDILRAKSTSVHNAIKTAVMPAGMYYSLEPGFTAVLKDLEQGFDCINMRYTCYLSS
jgi:hypothetical protein